MTEYRLQIFFAHVDELGSTAFVKCPIVVEQNINGANICSVAMLQGKTKGRNGAAPTGLIVLRIGYVSAHDRISAEASCSAKRVAGHV